MSHTIMLIPTTNNVSLAIISLGIRRLIEKKGVGLTVFKPIMQSSLGEEEFGITLPTIHSNPPFSSEKPMTMSYVKALLSSNQQSMLMEEIIVRYHHINAQKDKIVLVEGLVPTYKCQFITALNYEIARTLNAKIIFILPLHNNSQDKLKEDIDLICLDYGGNKNKNIIGVIINNLIPPVNKSNCAYLDLLDIFDDSGDNTVDSIDPSVLSKNSPLPLLGYIPRNLELIVIRTIDVVHHLGATIIHEGEIESRRVTTIVLCTCSLSNILENFRSGALLIIPSDRNDILVAACLATVNGIEISAILLTGSSEIDPCIYKLCLYAFQTGLPVFKVQINTWQTLLSLKKFNLEFLMNDCKKIEKLQNYVAKYIDNIWLESLLIKYKRLDRFSPPAFRYHLTELARQASKRIVLPEGNEPRTVKAASICAKRGIAYCILIGNPNEIQHIATSQGVTLNKNIEIIDPKIVCEKYVTRLIELRKSIGISEMIARKQLEDNIVLGTLMLEQEEVDGLVSGAIHTTANTIRPSLQLIKTAPGNSLVSSVFFMLLPEQVLVYGDCAINPNPTSEQLAEIAIQSADSAVIFGIEPYVAMISYSSGNSGTGKDIEKVRKATSIAQKKRPDLLIDGPLQYDAAISADVALLKAPDSPVAGRATVFIFPDLNTGNTTYKAVQRSANLIAIGPMLQGIRKPVNDLSRGALVDDIVYTIALTAIQSKQAKY